MPKFVSASKLGHLAFLLKLKPTKARTATSKELTRSILELYHS
jgi:hypothetical protein